MFGMLAWQQLSPKTQKTVVPSSTLEAQERDSFGYPLQAFGDWTRISLPGKGDEWIIHLLACNILPPSGMAPKWLMARKGYLAISCLKMKSPIMSVFNSEDYYWEYSLPVGYCIRSSICSQFIVLIQRQTHAYRTLSWWLPAYFCGCF